MNIHDRFEEASDEFLDFERVQVKLSERPDLHAFLLLDKRFPHPGRDIVSAAEHDEIWLDVGDEQAETLTDEEIADLVRCGVRHHRNGGLCMFA